MNELDLIHEFGAETPLLSLSELSSVRDVVTGGITGIAAGEDRYAFPAPAAERRGRKRHGPARRVVIGSVTVAAAAAITAGVLVGVQAPHRGGARAALSGGTPSGTTRSGEARSGGTPSGEVVPAQLTAREVLDRAAAAALRGPDVVPSGDQFVYTEVGGGAGAPVVRTWLSVDGTRNGLSTTTYSDGKVQSSTFLGCANGVQKIQLPGVGGKPLKLGGKAMTPTQYQEKYKTPVPMHGPIQSVPCTPEPAYFPDMPTSAGAMAGYLERTQGIRVSNLNDLAKTVGFMLQSDYILPAQRAALYEFLATTPGLIVEPNVRDIDGRPGVGVGWSFEGSKAMNIFDPSTYAYLGLTTWGLQGQLAGDALLKTAITNTPGQLP
jgi:hypothetical protein